ncbi:Transcription initiation factor TFIID subunit 8 [Quillaja saponaria]|uniref:Transcription initiation factor TFIID subunit 8 n=1 Tax=Quillaja saponaria TaxID=32244 RepID=A0AAD7KQB3_QUISA|nr:Transcription initiation factor TFIID subunit 8 [Quillaja saponaria]
MALLGDDGRGYELARKIETIGVWRTWLGDSSYANFVHFLSSPSAWEAFMRVDESKTKAQIQLQLRVRALLFDKASVSLFLRSRNSSSSSYLLLLYRNSIQLICSCTVMTYISRLRILRKMELISEKGVLLQLRHHLRCNQKQLLELDQDMVILSLIPCPKGSGLKSCLKYGIISSLRSIELINHMLCHILDRELEKRTPEEMAAYLKCIENHKKRCVAFKEDQYRGFGDTIPENTSNIHPNGSNLVVDDDSSLFPEIMFRLNSIPDCACPPANTVEDNQKIEFYGVLDTLPQVMTRSPVMIERLGVRPEYLNMEHGGSLYRGKLGPEGNRKHLGQEQASRMSQKVVARMLIGAGFEGATEVPIEVFTQLLNCHISKLGRILKVITDNYRKQCSAIELLKMFLKTVGYSNFGPLAELVKEGSRNFVQHAQTQRQVHGIQSQLPSQLPSQHQNTLRLPQQVPRQMHSQMQQIIHSQNLAYQQQQQQQQQQLDRTRRRQPSTPRPSMDMDKDRPLVQVKLENPSDLPIDNNAFNTLNAKHQHLQFRQQQVAAMPNFHSQSTNQFRQMTSVQMPQIQSQNMGVVRAPPVKVEGFQELMGGDSTSKHDSDENRLTSPLSK